MAKALTIQDFFKKFPNEGACQEHLFQLRFGPEYACPKCGEIGKFRKLTGLPAYTCNCGHHVHPMKGTIFTDSHTPLVKWFYAIYLFTTTRHGVSAKELQRQIGVSYPTAFRMAGLIREHMGLVDGDSGLSGHVEVDETYVGGVRKGHGGRSNTHKTAVFGMLQRGGNVMTRIVPNVKMGTLKAHIRDHIARESTISSDEFKSYKDLMAMGYKHGAVNHSHEQWVDGIHHTNSLEGFWSMVKRSIRGTHVHVSRKYLWRYLVEFEFRYNLRHSPETMFAKLILSF